MRRMEPERRGSSESAIRGDQREHGEREQREFGKSERREMRQKRHLRQKIGRCEKSKIKVSSEKGRDVRRMKSERRVGAQREQRESEKTGKAQDQKENEFSEGGGRNSRDEEDRGELEE